MGAWMVLKTAATSERIEHLTCISDAAQRLKARLGNTRVDDRILNLHLPVHDLKAVEARLNALLGSLKDLEMGEKLRRG